MKCKYALENIFPRSLSFEEMKDIICKNIAGLVVLEENMYYGNK